MAAITISCEEPEGEEEEEDTLAELEDGYLDVEEELQFDPCKDLWVSVRVDRQAVGEAAEISSWVWEVSSQ